MRRALSAVALATAIVACTDPATQPELGEARFAKPGPTEPLPPNQYGTVALSSSPSPDAVGTDYIHGSCGVSIVIFYNNGGNDGVLQTDNPVNKTSSCGAWPRTFTIQTPVGSLTGTRLSVRDLGGVADQSSATRKLAMYFPNATCDRLRWDSANVVRVGDTFTVNATGAFCLDSKGRVKAEYPDVNASFTLVQRETP